LPLTGADCFLRAFDHEVRRKNGASHASQLVLRLGPGFDPDAFAKLIAEVTAANPILHAPIRRRLGVGAPAYRLSAARPSSAPRIEIHRSSASDQGLPELFFERMNQRFDGRRGELLRFDIVLRDEGRQGADLAMTWLHMLFDGAGSEAFLRWLSECHRGLRRVKELPEDEATHAPGMPAGLTAKVRGRRATSWQTAMAGLGDPPPRSLAGPLRRERQALRYDVETLDARDSARAMERAQDRAGFLTPMLYYLAVSIRAHHAVFEARGLDPRSYVVPLPVNLRPRGSEEALFRTRVSLLWFRVLPEVVKDLDTLLADLKAQRHAAIKARQIENGVIAMDYARYAPMRLYAYMARRHMRGELCSFYFAYTGQFAAGLGEFLGAELRNGFHAPAVTPSPGSTAAISLFGDRMNITHVYQRTVFTDSECARFREQLLSDLLGTD
jgi:hypothetical protein